MNTKLEPWTWRDEIPARPCTTLDETIGKTLDVLAEIIPYNRARFIRTDSAFPVLAWIKAAYCCGLFSSEEAHSLLAHIYEVTK